MNKIDEIALRVAAEIGAVSYSPPPFRAVRGYSFTYDDLWRFTRALVADPELLAELSKDAEPSLYRWKSGHNLEYQFSEQRENAPEYATKYFTHPAPVIVSEQKPEEKDNAELDIDSNNAGTEQQRELDGKVEMGQLLDDSPNPTAGDSEIKRNLLLIGDGFRGDDLKLAASIEALIALNDSGALVPHGIGGHARSLLACAALRLLTSPPNIAEIEERVAEAIAKMIQGWSCTNGPSIAEAIRSGKWREYL